MRFTLQTRSADEPSWHKLPAAGFGKWLTSNAGIGRYVYTKRVIELEAPASYRTLVNFRWLDADGDRVASAKSTSPVCHQSDYRPNLRPLGVQAQARRRRSHARYLVPVVNRGRTPAGAVRRRRVGRRHHAHARAGARARAGRARARRGPGPAVPGRVRS